MLFALTGIFKPDIEAEWERVHERFSEHLAQPFLTVTLGGSLRDKDGRRRGVLLFLEAKDFETATAFAQSSPYVLEGLYQSVEVNELRLEVGRVE